MAIGQPLWKWHSWKSTGFIPYTHVICYWSLDLIFKGKLNLESGNWKIQYGHQAAILITILLKVIRLWPMATNNMHMKFEIEIPKQTQVTLQKPCQLQSPDTERSNMAARQPFWKWHCLKSIGFFPYTQLMCQWSLNMIFKAKLKLESGNRKIQYGHQAAILKVTSLKINGLLSVATNNMHMKFKIEFSKRPWVMLRKPCHLQTDWQTDRQMDKVIPVYPPPTSLGGGITSIPPTNFVGRGYNEFHTQSHKKSCLTNIFRNTLWCIYQSFYLWKMQDFCLTYDFNFWTHGVRLAVFHLLSLWTVHIQTLWCGRFHPNQSRFSVSCSE